MTTPVMAVVQRQLMMAVMAVIRPALTVIWAVWAVLLAQVGNLAKCQMVLKPLPAKPVTVAQAAVAF